MAEKIPLVKCPNYSICQTMVREDKAGAEHKYGVYSKALDEIVYLHCSGSG